MANNIVKIGGEERNEILTIEYKGKAYDIPLANAMKRKDLKKLKDEDSVEAMFAKYIPQNVLDDMSPDEYRQLAEAWTGESQRASGTDLGES